MDARGTAVDVVETASGKVAFSSTAWTVVANAQAQHGETSGRYLDLLVGRYWRPVYCFIRQLGNSHEDAKDLTQAFFTTFVERDVAAYADRERGKFRTFLIASVKRFLAERHRHEMRHPVPATLSDIDLAPREHLFQFGAGESPERVFDRNWAKCLLENSIGRFRSECIALDKEIRFRVFEERFLADPSRFAAYRDIAQKLGISVTDVRTHLERGRKRLARMIREEVSHCLSVPWECDAEIQELVACLR